MKKDISQMPSIVTKNSRYFYELDKDGNKVLRHILIGSSRNILTVPADGVTIDVVPNDSVGTDQIVNDSVEMEDLNQKVKDKMLTDDDRVTSEDIEKFNI